MAGRLDFRISAFTKEVRRKMQLKGAKKMRDISNKIPILLELTYGLESESIMQLSHKLITSDVTSDELSYQCSRQCF